MREIFAAPIFIRLGARMRGPAGVPIGVVRRVNISSVTCINAASPRICSIISGIPGHSIEDVRISDVTILHQGGGTAADAALRLPEKEKDYPEPTMFGTTPAQGVFIRHAKGIEMSDIKIESASEDARPVFQLDDVQGADFRFVKLPAAEGKSFALTNVHDFSVFRCKPVADAELSAMDEKRL